MTRSRKKTTAAQRKLRRLWNTCRDGVVVVLSAALVFLILRYGFNYFIDNFIKPVDENDAVPIEVVIPSKSSASAIARILYKACGEDEKGLIQNTAIFKVYVDFVGRANKMKAGTYILSRNMTMEQIVDVICEGNAPKQTVTFTIPEGYTVEEIAEVLLKKGLLTDTAPFLKKCMTGEGLDNFDFIASVLSDPDKAKRKYVLEGYLFPDTYEVYKDSTVDTILIKFLNRFNEVYTESYRTRAAELGFSTDEVVTLASVIQREAQVDGDFAKVSAVFRNRLTDDMALQSCASLSYALNVKKYTFTAAELELDSPFNTYKSKGLPTGAIANPGKLALETALYPNEDYVSAHYLYFCNGNPAISSELLFSKTYEEHQQNVKEYQQYWK